jgi:hypothetical protein
MEQTGKQRAGDLYWAMPHVSSVDCFAAVQRKQQGFRSYICLEVAVLLGGGATSLGDWCPTVRDSVVIASSKVKMSDRQYRPQLRLCERLKTLIMSLIFMMVCY